MHHPRFFGKAVAYIALFLEICLGETHGANASDGPVRICRGELARPVGTLGAFQGEQFFYHLARLERVRHSNASSLPSYRYQLVGIHLPTHRLQVLMSIKLPKVGGAIYHGEPISGLLAVAFRDHESPCLAGPGYFAAIALPTPTSKMRVMKDKGTFHFVHSKGGYRLFNTEKNHLIEVDFRSMQLRSQFVSIRGGEVPLYVDLGRRHLYTWRLAMQRAVRGLVAYDNAGNAAARVQFARGDKLLHQQNLFGVAKIDAIDNKISIVEMPKWSSARKYAAYPLSIPNQYSVRQASIQVNFATDIAVVQALTAEDRKQWRRVLIYNYADGTEIGKLGLEPGTHVEAAYLSGDGKYVVASVSPSETSKLPHYLVFSTTSRQWKRISFPVPVSDDATGAAPKRLNKR